MKFFKKRKIELGSAYEPLSSEQKAKHKTLAFLIVGVMVVAVIIFIISKTSSDSVSADSKVPLTKENQTATRNCFLTETKCPSGCRNSNGTIGSEAARSPDGEYCCSFQCSDEFLQVRNCTAAEKVCSSDMKCRMSDSVVMPVARTPGGSLCCQFECGNDTFPVRACNMGSEVVCPAGSYCYDFNRNITLPKAQMQNGNSCCAANGTDTVCAKV